MYSLPVFMDPSIFADDQTSEVQYSFTQWLGRYSPEFNWAFPHLVHIRRQLADITLGSCKRLILNIPPQHGKSQHLTVRYPIWRMYRDPKLRVAVGAYNQGHANRFSRQSRRIARQVLDLDIERKAANEWLTTQGGSFIAVGVGGGLTGNPVDLMVIDDPVKNREEADSPANQERVWEWYMDDVTTRLQMGAPVILVMTRWHENDLTGKILASPDGPNWRHIKLPALAEENDPLGRAVGDPLCPELHDKADLEEKQSTLGEGFYGLYQQTPIPRGGLFFKREWFGTVTQAPPLAERVRYWDLAASVKDRSKFTAGVLISKHEGRFYIEDVVRGRWLPAERNENIRKIAEADSQIPGFRKTYFEEQPGAAGVETSEHMIRKLAGLKVESDRVTGSKEVRAEAFADQARAGLVKLVEASWNSDYLSELASFPRGTYCDQVDSTSGGFNKLNRNKGVILF